MPTDCDRRYLRSTRRYPHDYAEARARAGLALQSHAEDRRYAHAISLAKSFAIRRRAAEDLLAKSFRAHVERWKAETGHLSSLRKAVAHPSYRSIIDLARWSSKRDITRLLLNELEAEPDHWFPALAEITGEDPTKPGDDFDDAVAAWLLWGKGKGII